MAKLKKKKKPLMKHFYCSTFDSKYDKISEFINESVRKKSSFKFCLQNFMKKKNCLKNE